VLTSFYPTENLKGLRANVPVYSPSAYARAGRHRFVPKRPHELLNAKPKVESRSGFVTSSFLSRVLLPRLVLWDESRPLRAPQLGGRRMRGRDTFDFLSFTPVHQLFNSTRVLPSLFLLVFLWTGQIKTANSSTPSQI